MGESHEIDVSTALAIDRALAVVEQTLDRLVERGQETTAFEVARAQFRARVRASWPGNMSGVVGLLTEVERDPKSKLDEAERAQLRAALELLRSITNP